MNYFKPTLIFIVVLFSVGTAYDIWAVSHTYEWTISATLYHLAQQWPAIPFALGFLLGHVFFPNRASNK